MGLHLDQQVSLVLPPPAHVVDAVGLDVPGVDRRLLIVFADAGQVGEEIGPVSQRLRVKPGVELANDVLPGVQALLLRPGPAVIIPGQTRGTPLVMASLQPAGIAEGLRQPVKAPPGGGRIELLSRPLHDHERPAGNQRCPGQVQHLTKVSDMVQ